MDEAPFSQRELQAMFQNIDEKLDRVEAQTTKTNGRVSRLERAFTIVVTIIVVVIALKFPELLGVVHAII